MQFSNVRHQSFISGQGLCFFLIKQEAPLSPINEKRSWLNANETTTSNQLILNQIVLPNIHWLNTTDMKMDLNTKLNQDQNICKDQYIRVNLYAPTTAVHMGQFNSTDIQFICICTIYVCQNALNIDVLFSVFLFLVIFNTWIVWHRKKFFFVSWPFDIYNLQQIYSEYTKYFQHKIQNLTIHCL